MLSGMGDGHSKWPASWVQSASQQGQGTRCQSVWPTWLATRRSMLSGSALLVQQSPCERLGAAVTKCHRPWQKQQKCALVGLAARSPKSGGWQGRALSESCGKESAPGVSHSFQWLLVILAFLG